MNNLRVKRLEAGLTQVELARISRIASTNISAIESGRLQAWPNAKKRLSKALKCKISEIFPEEVAGNGKNKTDV